MVLMQNNWGSARITNGQKNQLANESGTPVAAVALGTHQEGGRPEQLEQH